MAKLKLELPLEVDFDLVAIVTPLRNYRLVFFINRMLGTDLARKEDMVIDYVKKQQVGKFPKYHAYQPLEKIHLYVINNYSPQSGSHLIPELKKVDFLMMIKGDESEGFKQLALKKIMNIPQVQTCFTVNAEELFSKQNLIFDDETF